MINFRHCSLAVPRRDVLVGLATSLLATTSCQGRAGQAGNSAQATGRRRPAHPLSRFGVDRFSNRDQWARLKLAFAAAHDGGFDLEGDPDAQYHHDGPLSLDGVSFDGQGCTLRALSDGPQVLRCIGRNFRIANLRILGAASARTSDNWDNGIWIGDEGGQSASEFVLDNVTVDAVSPGRGVAAAGFMFNDAHHGRIIRPVVRRSFADGIHITNGSSDLVFDRPLSESTGDDGFAVVSYVRQKRICRNIRAIDGISRDSAARGFTVVGGVDVVYERPQIERSAAAGLYLYGEGAFDTFGVERCQVIAPVIRNCVTGRNLPTGFGQAAITIGGREGEDLVEGQHVTRGAADCVVHDPVVEGVGPACYAAVAMHQFAIRPRITGAKLINIAAANAATRPNGIEIGGRDVIVENPQMTNIAGVAIVLNRTASGQCQVTAPMVSGSRLAGGPVDSIIYVENASALTNMVVRGGRFSRGPKRLSISLVPAGKLHLEDNQIR